ncbi:MAG: hypothetical protein OXR62_12875 [Ahrensia sp.]|nr:hypothetical protein [Ahrensia sp.]
MTRSNMITALCFMLVIGAFSLASAQARTLTQAEIQREMLNKPITTRRFGMRVSMVYRSNGTVTARALIGTFNGTWKPQGNRVCTTFPSGPAKGTRCVSYTKIGDNRYRTSDGVTFRVGG